MIWRTRIAPVYISRQVSEEEKEEEEEATIKKGVSHVILPSRSLTERGKA